MSTNVKVEGKVTQVESPQKRMALIPKVDVFFDHFLTSTHSQRTKLDLIEMDGSNEMMSPDQVVVAAGPNSPVQVGDWIRINVDKFPRSGKPGGHEIGTVYKVHPPIELIGSTKYLYLSSTHIKFRLHKK